MSGYDMDCLERVALPKFENHISKMILQGNSKSNEITNELWHTSGKLVTSWWPTSGKLVAYWWQTSGSGNHFFQNRSNLVAWQTSGKAARANLLSMRYELVRGTTIWRQNTTQYEVRPKAEKYEYDLVQGTRLFRSTRSYQDKDHLSATCH